MSYLGRHVSFILSNWSMLQNEEKLVTHEDGYYFFAKAITLAPLSQNKLQRGTCGLAIHQLLMRRENDGT